MKPEKYASLVFTALLGAAGVAAQQQRPINPANPPPGSGRPGAPINPSNPPPGSGRPGAPINPANPPPGSGSGGAGGGGGGAPINPANPPPGGGAGGGGGGAPINPANPPPGGGAGGGGGGGTPINPANPPPGSGAGGGGGGAPINPANPPPGGGAGGGGGGAPINPVNPPPGSGAPGAPISPGNPPPAPGTGPPGGGGGGAAGNCPVPRTGLNLSPPPTTQVSCPTSDGSVWESYDGTWYYLQCCTAANAQALSLGLPQVHTYEDCIDQCSGVPNCQAATFDPSIDQCVLYDFGVFSQTAHSVQLYAFATDPPVTQTPSLTSRLCSTSCPGANGQIYVSSHGQTFRMDCKKRHGTQVLSKDVLSSLEECMELCSAAPSCSSVDFDEKRGICYQSINDGPPALNAPTFASAHAVGCSGACEGCGNGCSKPVQQQVDDPDQCTNDNAVVYRGGMPFRVRCNHCSMSQSGDLRTNIKTHDECMEAFVAEESQYDAANWVTGQGCYLKPGPISSIDPNTGCSATFFPLWK